MNFLKPFTFILTTTLAAVASADDYSCPEGSKKIGLAPPQGYQVKCVDENGAQHGPYWMWYRSGQIMQALNFKNGLEHGKQKAWFPNGNVMMEGVSVEGARNKGFKYFNYFGAPVKLEFKTEQEAEQN